jgi:hypothetical protein
MKLVIRKLALRSIAKTGVWVEKKNTGESGQRWINKVYATLQDHARLGVKHAICKDEDLAKRKYHCFTYNDKWIVAYRIKGNDFVVYRFIFGPYLK